MSRQDGAISNGCYLGIAIGNRLGQKMHNSMNYRGALLFCRALTGWPGPVLVLAARELGWVHGSRPLECEQYLAETPHRTVVRPNRNQARGSLDTHPTLECWLGSRARRRSFNGKTHNDGHRSAGATSTG